MSDINDYHIHNDEAFAEFDDLVEDLKNYAKMTDKKVVNKVLHIGADMMVADALKLPYPISKIRSAGYTHMVKSFSAQDSSQHKNEVEVGWGVYYGPMVEHGTQSGGNGASGQKGQPHLIPLWQKNRDKYYKAMIKELDRR